MLACALSERVGCLAEPRPMALNPPACPGVGSPKPGRAFNNFLRPPSDDEDRCASADKSQLSGVEFGDGFFHLLVGDDLLAGLDFDDVALDGDLVHGSLRPVKCLGLLAPDCASCRYIGEYMLSLQDQMLATRVRVRLPS
jgi:hypothetical protein